MLLKDGRGDRERPEDIVEEGAPRAPAFEVEAVFPAAVALEVATPAEDLAVARADFFEGMKEGATFVVAFSCSLVESAFEDALGILLARAAGAGAATLPRFHTL